MEIEKALSLLRTYLDKFGLHDWTIGIDRALERRGRVTYDIKHITLSRFLIPIATKEEIIEAILHEVAHALVGPGFGHGEVWKAKYLEIGGNGKTTFTGDSPSHKWKAVCPSCQKEFFRHRRQFKKRESCTACGNGKFDERYLVQFEKS